MSWADLAEQLRDLGARVRDEAARVSARSGYDTESGALSAFIRPNLGPTPRPLRRVLEPVVAASAVLALVVLLGFGMFSFAGFFIASSLIYLIITQIFGIELDLNLPT